MRRAAAAAGKSELLDRYAKDYPTGPHDQPQSMCPAFGSLRVGLRMRRTATVLSGSACCVYGLTFTSHFYGARRTVGYVPFNSETLVTGKLFEDIREAVYKLADPGALRCHRHHQSLCADGVRRAAEAAARADRRRPHHRHRRAGLRRADARGGQGCARRRDAEIRADRSRAGTGAGASRRQERADRRSRCSARCSPPIRSASACCSSRSASPPAPSCRRANGASSTARSIAPRWRRSIPSTRPRSANSKRPDARSSARRLSATTARPRGWTPSAQPAALRATKSMPPRTVYCPPSAARWRRCRSRGALRFRATKARSCSSRACSSRAAPTCATSARLARARAGPIRTANGSRPRACGHLSRLARAGYRRGRGIQARSRHRHDARRAEGQSRWRSRRSISPT